MIRLSLLFIMGTLLGCYSAEPEKTGKEGQPIPSFNILLSDSITRFDSKEITEGKPSVLFYYGPSCPYSRAEMDDIIEEMSTLKEVQLFIITSWPFSLMKKFSSHYQLTKYPNVITGYDYKNSVGKYYKITGVPFTAVYGKDKKMIQAFQGQIYAKQILKTLEK